MALLVRRADSTPIGRISVGSFPRNIPLWHLGKHYGREWAPTVAIDQFYELSTATPVARYVAAFIERGPTT